MSKVNTQIASLFHSKQIGSVSNTTVTEYSVILHGNPIAKRSRNGSISVCNGGYVSNTTITRLKAIADVFDWPFTFRSQEGDMYAQLRADKTQEVYVGEKWMSVNAIRKKLGL